MVQVFNFFSLKKEGAQWNALPKEIVHDEQDFSILLSKLRNCCEVYMK